MASRTSTHSHYLWSRSSLTSTCVIADGLTCTGGHSPLVPPDSVMLLVPGATDTDRLRLLTCRSTSTRGHCSSCFRRSFPLHRLRWWPCVLSLELPTLVSPCLTGGHRPPGRLRQRSCSSRSSLTADVPLFHGAANSDGLRLLTMYQSTGAQQY